MKDRIPTDAEALLASRDPENKPEPPRPPVEKPPGLIYKILAAAWWTLIGAGAVYFMTYKAPEPAPQKHIPKAELQIKESKAIGPNEELRVIWMPSGIEDIGNRCLLYTNKENSATSIACSGIEVNLE